MGRPGIRTRGDPDRSIMRALQRGSVAGVLAAVLLLTGCTSAAPDVFEPEGFTPEQYQDAVWNSIMGAYPDAERPDVEVVRVISNADFADIFTACMLDQGFEVEVFQDTSFSADVPEAQQEAFAMAMYTCEAMYPRPFLLTVPDDEHTGRVLYAYYTDELIPCLEDLGYTIEAPPSEQVYLQNLDTAQRYDPYASLVGNGGIGMDEWNAANEQCPQRPAALGG